MGGGSQRTENGLLSRSENVDAERHLDLVDLELQPLAEALEVGRHDDELVCFLSCGDCW